MMKPNKQFFLRITTVATILLLAFVAAFPGASPVTAAAAFTPDDFNRCSLNTSIWTFENPASFPAATIHGQYMGDSYLTLTVPAGHQGSFSDSNKDAPRIIQSASDADFEVEAKFSTPLGAPPVDSWNIQGILVRGTSPTPGTSRWLRFDLDTKNQVVGGVNQITINYYVGYIDETGALHHLSGPNIISTAVTSAPLYLRMKYEKALDQWSVGYKLTDAGTFSYKKTFKETDVFPTLPSGFTLDVNGIGVFAGSTGVSPSGIESKVDYFRSVPDAFADDANVLQVTKSGNGSGTVNWPMTNPATQCSGNQVTITAQPGNGSSFGGWSGDVSTMDTTIMLTMTQSYNIDAKFVLLIDQPYHFYLPIVQRN